MTLGSLSLFEIDKEEAPSLVNMTDREVAVRRSIYMEGMFERVLGTLLGTRMVSIRRLSSKQR
jgi:hypothetical protein